VHHEADPLRDAARARAKDEIRTAVEAELKAKLEVELERMRMEMEALRSSGQARAGAATLASADPVMYDGLEILWQLAHSGQAVVYRAMFQGEEVAAKVFHVSGSALAQFRSEVFSLLYVVRLDCILK
jgi:hypothetical protein